MDSLKAILTLDYELYFGRDTGRPQVAMIEATDRLVEVLNRYDAKAVFFVDATYLLSLKVNYFNSKILQADYDNVVSHIKKLEADGHQIQLHIHPHWIDSVYDGSGWKIKTDRYRLADWTKSEAQEIIINSIDELNSHLNKKVFVFRAGGWCIQPFAHISDALLKGGVTVDSTVFKNGRSNSDSHMFDFSVAPDLAFWKFRDDPCIPDPGGPFLELPIASMRVSPLFFWRVAFTKIFSNSTLHRSFGSGVAISNSRSDIVRLMTSFSNSVVSVDGYKSTLLLNSYKNYLRREMEYFVVIGHPKALSEYSLKNISNWLCFLQSRGEKLKLF